MNHHIMGWKRFLQTSCRKTLSFVSWVNLISPYTVLLYTINNNMQIQACPHKGQTFTNLDSV